MENECKTPIGCVLHSISIKNIFYDKMDLSHGVYKKWKLRIWSHLLKKSLIENFIFWCETAHDS